MRVLIIEDNQDVLIGLKIALEKNNLCVDVANNGIEGEEKAFVNDYDIILLDLGLPDKKGEDIVTYLRAEHVKTPIVIMTSITSINSVIKLFHMGVDEYIVKPFQIEELLARMQAIIRRVNGRSEPDIKIGDLLIDPISRKVSIKGNKLELTGKEYDILEYIGTKYPAVISSEEILEHVYDEYFDRFSSVLRVHISKLKKKLKRANGEEMLLTQRGKGYYLKEIEE